MSNVDLHESKSRLLDSAAYVIRSKGYAAATIDDVCLHAGLTKGSFFHHFKSKDALALSAIDRWASMAETLFENAPYHVFADPLERLLGYIDFRETLLIGEIPDYTCLLGTLVQETYATHPEIRAACSQRLSRHIAELTRDVESAKKRYTPRASWSAQGVGYFIQTVLQGSFIFAKARHDAEPIRESLSHLRRYLTDLFRQPAPRKARAKR